jgi:replicative DNA helicase
LVIAINANDDEKAEGERRLYFVASRNQEDGMSIRIKTDLNRAKFMAKILGRE